MTVETMNPVAAGTANGAWVALPLSVRLQGNHPGHSDASGPLTFSLPPDSVPITVAGREARTMRLLIWTGPRGFTSEEASTLRWARRPGAYVHRLRGMGVPILTTLETVGDARVGRYTLAGPVVVLVPGEE